jgi:hypothetical protein
MPRLDPVAVVLAQAPGTAPPLTLAGKLRQQLQLKAGKGGKARAGGVRRAGGMKWPGGVKRTGGVKRAGGVKRPGGVKREGGVRVGRCGRGRSKYFPPTPKWVAPPGYGQME